MKKIIIGLKESDIVESLISEEKETIERIFNFALFGVCLLWITLSISINFIVKSNGLWSFAQLIIACAGMFSIIALINLKITQVYLLKKINSLGGINNGTTKFNKKSE